MCGRIPKARAEAQIHMGEYSRLIDFSIETSFNFIFKRDWHESMRYFILSMGTFTITTFFLVFWSGIRLTKEHALFYMYFILSVRTFKNGTWNTHSGCYSSPPLASSFLFPQLTSSCCQYMCHIRMSYSGNWRSEPTRGEWNIPRQESILDYWVHIRISSSPFLLLMRLHNANANARNVSFVI